MKKYVTEAFVLNPPKFEFSNIDKFKNEIIYIKKDKENYIPCLFIQELNQCNKFLIIFHGNNEDIFEMEMAAGIIREELKMNVIVVEYPGYSIYFSQRNPKIILEDTTIVYDFIKEKFNVNDEDIFIYGRSIGSAPSIYLASKRKAKALFVVSGFSSLKEVGKGLYVGWALEDIFKNIEYISKISIPILFIHGKKDSLISWEQSYQLFDNCKTKIKDIKIIYNMEHNKYDLKDILNKINDFISNQLEGIDRINKYYNLYNEKFDEMLTMPNNISNYINSINFTLKGYSKYDKFFDKKINFIILLKDERISLVFDYEIQVCDTINFNKYFSVKSNNNIIFANSLKNDNFLYCTNDATVNIIEIGFSNYSIKYKFKIDNNKLDTCKIIEIDDNNFMAILNSYYPLIKIYKDKDEYKLSEIKTFKNLIINDIINIDNNQIAFTCSQRSLLIIYNYLTQEKKDLTIKSNSLSSLFFFEHQYLIILNSLGLVIFNLFSNEFKYRNFSISIQSTFNNISTIELIPKVFYYNNPHLVFIGCERGFFFIFDLENIIIEEIENITITMNKCIIFDDNSDIKNIFILQNRNILVLTENNNCLKVLYKNVTSEKNQKCLIC